tara:strand:+ start:169 stop:540 length:372 start_codon:yes stop_codon:yes gene_type:complete
MNIQDSDVIENLLDSNITSELSSDTVNMSPIELSALVVLCCISLPLGAMLFVKSIYNWKQALSGVEPYNDTSETSSNVTDRSSFDGDRWRFWNSNLQNNSNTPAAALSKSLLDSNTLKRSQYP